LTELNVKFKATKINYLVGNFSAVLIMSKQIGEANQEFFATSSPPTCITFKGWIGLCIFFKAQITWLTNLQIQ